MVIKPVQSRHHDDIVYLYDDQSFMPFASVTIHQDGSLSIQVTTEVEVYRAGVKLVES
jgi:hypothetical protein